MQEMPKRLKLLRKRLNLTQEEFAKKIGLSRANVGNIEYGRVLLTDRNISTICQIFNVNEEWLRNGTEPIFKEKTENLIDEMVTEFNLSNIDKTILEKFVNLTPEQRKEIILTAQKLVKLLSAPPSPTDTEEDKDIKYENNNHLVEIIEADGINYEHLLNNKKEAL